MSTQTISQKSYIGPRALFDPYYIPSELVGLDKEQKIMDSLLKDAIQDQYPIVLSLYGLRGIGKTALTKKAISNLTPLNTRESPPIQSCYVNCEEKGSNQIIFSMIDKLSSSLNYDLPPESILHASTSNQINMLSHLITKTQSQKKHNSLLFLLDSIEYTQPLFINKIMDICTSQFCFLVTSFNLLKSSPFLMEFKKPDIQIQLNTYTPSNLEKISMDRCNIAFTHPIERTIIRYITDLVNEFDYSVPESCLRVLRELYPVLESNSPFIQSQIQDVSRYQFKCHSIDEISIAEFVSETDMVDRLAIDELSSFFHSQSRFYINFAELVNIYKVACENLENQFNSRNFKDFLHKLQRVDLLQPSKFNSQKTSTQQNPTNQLYFLTISPQMLNDILDVAFGLIAFD
jgi:hypothetical protein